MRLYVLLLALFALMLGGFVAVSGNEAPRTMKARPAAAAPVAVAAPAAPAKVVSAAEAEATARSFQIRSSLGVLQAYVTEQSHPEALKRAVEAYYNFKAENPRQVKKPYFYYVDYGLDSREPRGYVFDMEKLELVDGPFTVSHGRGSLAAPSGVPTRFTNVEGSATSSLGLYVAQETYGFSGKSAGVHYTSIGLRMKGVSGKFNSRARERGIVVHGAPYVTGSKAGRSEGCPAMEQSRARKLIPQIANGGLVFLFSPQDDAWLEQEPWDGDPVQRLAEGA